MEVKTGTETDLRNADSPKASQVEVGCVSEVGDMKCEGEGVIKREDRMVKWGNLWEREVEGQVSEVARAVPNQMSWVLEELNESLFEDIQRWSSQERSSILEFQQTFSIVPDQNRNLGQWWLLHPPYFHKIYKFTPYYRSTDLFA